jgi:hypothetical protein
MEILTAWAASSVFGYVLGGAAAVALAWILRRIPNEKIKASVGKVAYATGVAMTLGMSKWKYTAPVWNKTIEPWFVDLIDNVIGEAVKKFIEGLHSDNPK